MAKHINFKIKIIIINNNLINSKLFKIRYNKIKLTKINNFNIMIQVINIHTNKDKNQKILFNRQDLDHNMLI